MAKVSVSPSALSATGRPPRRTAALWPGQGLTSRQSLPRSLVIERREVVAVDEQVASLGVGARPHVVPPGFLRAAERGEPPGAELSETLQAQVEAGVALRAAARYVGHDIDGPAGRVCAIFRHSR